MQQLADSQNNSLHSLTIAFEKKWFSSGESLNSLVTFIARQTDLNFLIVHENGLNEEEMQQIRNAVANSDCRIIITDKEYWAYIEE